MLWAIGWGIEFRLMLMLIIDVMIRRLETPDQVRRVSKPVMVLALQYMMFRDKGVPKQRELFYSDGFRKVTRLVDSWAAVVCHTICH